MKNTWKEALRNPGFLVVLGITCITLIALAILIPDYFQKIIGPKRGIVLNDWMLNQITPHDWSVTIFVIIYSAVALTLLAHIRNPEIMLVGMVTYSIVTWFRMLTIYLFTLEAPHGLIYLRDPFLTAVVYEGTFTKDLFFSGHVSTMTVLVLIEPIRTLKWIKVVAGVAVAILILVQHVHYSVDVFFAPVFTWAIYWLVIRFKKPLIG